MSGHDSLLAHEKQVEMTGSLVPWVPLLPMLGHHFEEGGQNGKQEGVWDWQPG